MPAALPCKTQREKYRETCRVEKKCKTKYACIVEADESTRKRMEGSLHKYHEDHIAGKGMNSLSHYNLVHKFIPVPQAIKKNTRCTGSSGKIMGKTLENTSMAAAESQKPKGGDRWSKEWGQNRTCCVVNGRTSSQEFGVGTQNSEIQRSSCTPKWHCERWFRIGITIYWAKIISITNDGCKSHGCQSKATRMRTTSSRRSIRLHPGQNGRCTDVTEKFQESECPDIWIRVAKHKWPKSWSSMEDPVVPLERNLYGHPLARLLWEKEFEKVLLEHGWEKVPSWECLFGRREKKDYSCLCMWTV